MKTWLFLLIFIATPVFAVTPEKLEFTDESWGTATPIGGSRYLTAHHVIDGAEFHMFKKNIPQDVVVFRGKVTKHKEKVVCRDLLWQKVKIVTLGRLIETTTSSRRGHMDYSLASDRYLYTGNQYYTVPVELLAGESGSPVIDPTDGAIVGVVSAGFDGYNIGAISPTCF